MAWEPIISFESWFLKDRHSLAFRPVPNLSLGTSLKVFQDRDYENLKMDPFFTLPWSEFFIADKLRGLLSPKKDYSIFIPLSRQEKGIDLAVLLKTTASNNSAVTTIQVKASRIWPGEAPKRKNIIRYKYNTWFNRFDVPERAEFIILTAIFTTNIDRPGKGSKKWYDDCSLLFTNNEMHQFFKECKNKKGKPDGSFGFGFNDLSSIILTRGDMDMGKTRKDFAGFLLKNRLDDIKRKINGEEPNETFPIILN